MIPINNSDLSWLITTDYNQDNNLPYEELRQDIISPNVNDWYYIVNINPHVGGKVSLGFFVGGFDHNPNLKEIIHILGYSVGTACMNNTNDSVGANE